MLGGASRWLMRDCGCDRGISVKVIMNVNAKTRRRGMTATPQKG